MYEPGTFEHDLPAATGLTIRVGNESDRRAIERLGELDEQDPGDGPHLVADEDGEVVAALSLADGTTVADPFRLTAAWVDLLRIRAAQLRAGSTSGRFSRPRLITN